jgi:hypothetical protein
MSGCLSVGGDLGKWTAATANNSLLVSQSALTVSVFLKVTSIPGSSVTSFAGGTANGAFNINPGAFGNSIKLTLTGLALEPTFNYTIVANQLIHIVGVINATGTSGWYINGVLKSSASNIGNTPAIASGILIGYGVTIPGDFLFRDLAIWSGTALGPTDIVALRDGLASPLTTSTPASSWWTLQGTAGQHPVASAGGIADQIGSNHFITLPGSGGATANAVYSAADLTYFPPISIAEAIVCRSGDIVKFSLGTNPALGDVVPAYPTAVSAYPAISVNGSPVTGSNLQGPFWSSVAFDDPWVMYQVVSAVPGQPAIQPTDVVTYTTPDSWVAASQGNAAPESGTCGNYAGSYEPGCFGYTGFNPPDSWKKLKLGYNLVGGESATSSATVGIMKNSAHRFGRTWNFATAYSATVPGLPIAIGNTSNWTAFTTVWQPNTFNGISSTSGFPVPTGTWTFVADETAPLAPMTPTLTGNSTFLSIAQHMPFTVAGHMVGGVETNKQWMWDVSYSNSASSALWANTIGFSLTAPTHTGNNQTLINLRLFEPGNAVSFGNVENVLNDNMLAMMTAAPGVYPAVVRSMEGLAGADGCSALLNADDYPANSPRVAYGAPATRTVADWTVNEPTFTGNRVIPIYQTRRYQPAPVGASSQYVYSANNYKGTTASGDPNFAFQWDLKALGLGYDWMSPTPNASNGKLAAVEFVVADASGNPINHNLQSGQLVATGGISPIFCTNASSPGNTSATVGTSTSTGPLTAVSITSGGTGYPASSTIYLSIGGSGTGGIASFSTNGSGVITAFVGIIAAGTGYTNGASGVSTAWLPTCSPDANFLAWVTSPTTFVGVFGTNMPAGATAMGWITGTTLTTWASASCTVIPTVIEYAIEDYGGFAQAMPGCGIWLAVNHCATDAAVTSLATRLFNATPRGTPIFVQFSNEILIPNFQFAWVNHIAALMQLTSDAQADMQRTGEVHTIFETVWGADSGSLVRIFQPFSVDPTTAAIAFQYAQANSIKIDAVALATYADMDPSPTFKMAEAAICVNENIAYPANGGLGTPSLTPARVSIAYTAGPGGATTPNGSPLPQMPMAAFADMYRHHLKYRKFFNGPTGQNASMYNALVASQYGTGFGSGWTYPLPIFIGYECNVSTAIAPGVSLATRIVRGGLTHDVMFHPSFYDVKNAFLQHLQEPGPVGTPGGYTFACIEALNSTRGFGFSSITCTDGFSDGASAECWGDCLWQGQRAGKGLSNSFWAQDLGGDGNVHEYNNQSPGAQADLDWILAASGGVAATVATMGSTERHDSAAALGRGPAVAVMAVTGRSDSMAAVSAGALAPAITKVSPSRIPVNTLGSTIVADQSVTLSLIGVSTNWTSGSTVTVTNSVTGTTTVTKGTWTRLSATTATLTVTTGLGTGTWHLTVDGIVSPTLVVGSRHHGWPGRMNRPRLQLRA